MCVKFLKIQISTLTQETQLMYMYHTIGGQGQYYNINTENAHIK